MYNCKSTLLTNMDMKVVRERVKRCIEDASSMDKPTGKKRKYNGTIPEQHAENLASKHCGEWPDQCC